MNSLSASVTRLLYYFSISDYSAKFGHTFSAQISVPTKLLFYKFRIAWWSSSLFTPSRPANRSTSARTFAASWRRWCRRITFRSSATERTANSHFRSTKKRTRFVLRKLCCCKGVLKKETKQQLLTKPMILVLTLKWNIWVLIVFLKMGQPRPLL